MDNYTVFISYAREDLAEAKRLYLDLKQHGFSPWIDVVSILPGERWKVSVKKAIGECRYFLALLSTRSVSRRGYVHKELSEALELLEMTPESDLFLIPVRLDDCQPSHERLMDLNWVNMFPSWKSGLNKIINALQVGTTQKDICSSDQNRHLDIFKDALSIDQFYNYREKK